MVVVDFQKPVVSLILLIGPVTYLAIGVTVTPLFALLAFTIILFALGPAPSVALLDLLIGVFIHGLDLDDGLIDVEEAETELIVARVIVKH